MGDPLTFAFDSYRRYVPAPRRVGPWLPSAETSGGRTNEVRKPCETHGADARVSGKYRLVGTFSSSVSSRVSNWLSREVKASLECFDKRHLQLL